MLNQIVLVGRLVSNPEGNTINLAVNRSYKNAEGIYETDFIDIKLSKTIAENVKEYCKKGDIVGIKGTLQQRDIDDGDGHILAHGAVVVADKVTFLSSKGGE
jgi:single-strand DNA-binding protein